jgi:hypothetical protein
MASAEVGAEQLRLRAFADARRAEQHQAAVDSVSLGRGSALRGCALQPGLSISLCFHYGA